jgi:hypothetical protein
MKLATALATGFGTGFVSAPEHMESTQIVNWNSNQDITD